MPTILLGVICLAVLVAAFALGWHLALRRHARWNKAAWIACKNVPYKVQGIDPAPEPAPAKHVKSNSSSLHPPLPPRLRAHRR
jgi:hypothetical protein